ncbi:hypothetical protein AN958_08953 [Leucoagaricus sp. SymC.cos]|nr:hypothetical protein AN958_08953 [Leucoagaricus sp. SymC.cos]
MLPDSENPNTREETSGPPASSFTSLHNQTQPTVDVGEDQEESTNPGRKCANCWTPACPENKLKFCAKCRAVMYCSRECQVADWKSHKQICSLNMAQAAQLAAVDELHDAEAVGPTHFPKGPSGLSWAELDAKLEKWVKHFGQMLMYTTIHALKLPIQYPRARTHLLHVTIVYNSDNGGKTGRFFDLDGVQVMSMEEAGQLDGAHRMSVEQLRFRREDSERRGRGAVIAAAVVCKPLAVQIVPFGSITQQLMKRMKWVENWEKNLRRCIASGNPNFGP